MRSFVQIAALDYLAVFVLGCHNRLCSDAGIAPNGRYKASVVELYNAQSTFTYDPTIGTGMPSCAQIDGLGPGIPLEMQGIGTVDDHSGTCELIAADLVSLPPQIMPGDGSAVREETYAAAQVSADGLIHASQQVTIAGCAGGYAVNVYAGSSTPPLSSVFDTPVPGQLPPAILFRIFVPVANSTCQLCEDNFVIQFVKD